MYSDCTLQLIFKKLSLVESGEASKKYPQLSEKAKYSSFPTMCVKQDFPHILQPKQYIAIDDMQKQI